ncbi:aprataxin-like [Antedon mediterranea]|uniref:aprataxin-like n=1 Tax=Antedon mediterranea TaxID=105859 RepID=UPI003AF5EA76
MSKIKRKHEDEGQSKPYKKKHWSLGLLDSMTDPDLIVEEDDLVTVIKDKYPKAKFHYLVLPKENITNLKRLNTSNIELLKHIHKCGEKIIKKAAGGRKIRLGYHAVASMSRLHLHAITQDFDSSCLKTKKHWNSFTTKFFVDSEVIIKQLEENGKVDLAYLNPSELLKAELKCHVCDMKQGNMPKLKAHIKQHVQDA